MINIDEKDFSEVDWLSYKKQMENQLKVNKMAVLNTLKTIEWIDENLKPFEQNKKKNETNTEKQS